MADVYPRGKDQFVSDPEWIRRANREGWVAISKDPSIRRDHIATLRETGLRLFVFPNANLTGVAMSERLIKNWGRIIYLASQQGPYVYAILPNSLEKRWP